MGWLTDPFSLQFVQRALGAGLIVATIGGIVGSYVVNRLFGF